MYYGDLDTLVLNCLARYARQVTLTDRTFRLSLAALSSNLLDRETNLELACTLLWEKCCRSFRHISPDIYWDSERRSHTFFFQSALSASTPRERQLLIYRGLCELLLIDTDPYEPPNQ